MANRTRTIFLAVIAGANSFSAPSSDCQKYNTPLIYNTNMRVVSILTSDSKGTCSSKAHLHAFRTFNHTSVSLSVMHYSGITAFSVRKYKPFLCGVHHVDHVLCFLSGDNHLPLLYLRIISYLQFQPPVRPWGGSGWEVLSIPPGPWCVRRPLRVCVALHVAAFTTPLAPPGLDPWDLSTQPPEAGESKRNEDET